MIAGAIAGRINVVVESEQHTGSRLPRIIGIVGAIGFLVTGVGAMAAPESFFDSVATFEPYNQHFVQDIGSFNLGLGMVLVLALRPRADALFAALAGAAIGSGAHVLSHVIGWDLGGTPELDVPLFAVLTILLAVAALVRHREA
jgi:hypothetical protein